jgi:ketosteroid isomerase-like protein
MSPSRRDILIAAGAGLAAFDAAAANKGRGERNFPNAVHELIERSAQSNAALMRGDIKTYLSLITVTDDFTLMSPFGGVPTRGSQLTEDTWKAIGRFFKNGTLEQEVIESYGSSDMVVLVLIERAQVEVGEIPRQEWALRVTLVYRLHDKEWRLAHRHADPLVPGITLKQAAAITRGDRECAPV